MVTNTKLWKYQLLCNFTSCNLFPSFYSGGGNKVAVSPNTHRRKPDGKNKEEHENG